MIEVTLLNEVTQVSDIMGMGSTSIATDSGPGGGGHLLYEGYYTFVPTFSGLWEICIV